MSERMNEQTIYWTRPSAHVKLGVIGEVMQYMDARKRERERVQKAARELQSKDYKLCVHISFLQTFWLWTSCVVGVLGKVIVSVSVCMWLWVGCGVVGGGWQGALRFDLSHFPIFLLMKHEVANVIVCYFALLSSYASLESRYPFFNMHMWKPIIVSVCAIMHDNKDRLTDWSPSSTPVFSGFFSSSSFFFPHRICVLAKVLWHQVQVVVITKLLLFSCHCFLLTIMIDSFCLQDMVSVITILLLLL